MKTLLSILSLALGATIPAASQSATERPAVPARAEVLVLGTYHMANPGHDIFNMKADDVLAPRRQAEIGRLTELLKRFRPTKIAVEADVYGDRIQKTYADYLAGNHELTRNETEQIGFRLAKELGHKTIYGVDVDGEFPYQRVVDYAKAAGRTKELDAIMAGGFGELVKAQDAYLGSHTIPETLLFINSDERAASEVALYYRQVHLGEPGDWAGADLLADWFRRNIRIFANIARLADNPGERVLVVYGAGHLAWLRQNVAGDPTLRLRKLADFAP
jgi:hypothetical protein